MKLRKGSETLREYRSEYVKSDCVLRHSDGLTEEITIGALEGVTLYQKMIHACTIDWYDAMLNEYVSDMFMVAMIDEFTNCIDYEDIMKWLDKQNFQE